MSRRTGQVRTTRVVASLIALLGLLAGVLWSVDQLARHDADLDDWAPVDLRTPDCPDRPVSEPAPVSSRLLLACPDTFDGAPVRYRGEVVRALLPRGDMAWARLNDDAYALERGPLPLHRTNLGVNSGMAVALPAEAADAVTHIGDGHHRGDRIEVVGTFRRADPDDGGGPTIHAETVLVVIAGHPVDRPVDPVRALVAVIAILAALGLTTAAQLSRRR